MGLYSELAYYYSQDIALRFVINYGVLFFFLNLLTVSIKTLVKICLLITCSPLCSHLQCVIYCGCECWLYIRILGIIVNQPSFKRGWRPDLVCTWCVVLASFSSPWRMFHSGLNHADIPNCISSKFKMDEFAHLPYSFNPFDAVTTCSHQLMILSLLSFHINVHMPFQGHSSNCTVPTLASTCMNPIVCRN